MPIHPDDGGPFFQLARMIIQQAKSTLYQYPEERERIVGHYERVEILLTHFLRLKSNRYCNILGLDEWIDIACELRQELQWRLEELEVYDYAGGLHEDNDVIPTISIPRFQQTTGGRPRYMFDWDTVLAYRSTGYTWNAFADLLSVSRFTLHRRRREDHIPEPQQFSDITNDELDNIIQNITQQSASILGSQYIQSAVLDAGFHVPRHRIRDSISRIDPLGRYNRWAAMIPCTVYSVAGPNSLWHIDGNLKLREYRFVLHAAIDGFSRYLIYLEANLNNRAQTVLDAFLHGISAVGQIPLRVRADKGAENRDMGLWMIVIRGENRGSFITGLSVYNQRIERIWREVNRWMTSFHLIFQHLRQLRLYDPDDPIDQFVLGFVYLPLVRRSLAKFIRIWNHHKLRTEGYRTPVQLYSTLADIQIRVDQDSRELSDGVWQDYGVDWEGPLPEHIREADDEEVENSAMVDPPERPVTEDQWRILTEGYKTILREVFEAGSDDWMLSNHNYGIDYYQDIRL